jgi:DNA polymerase
MAAVSKRVSVSQLDRARAEAAHCRACPLWANATQTVFGEGSEHALVMFVGEQPGDEEDKAGRPFVGPAGRVLDRALQEAGIDREATYVTNAVKHFKWEPRGKRRMHKTPAQQEIAACQQWLEREIALVRPRLIVCLGATAARALLGAKFKITEGRGRFYAHANLPEILPTFHPSYILRLRDEARATADQQFIADLKSVAQRLRKSTPAKSESSAPDA